MDTKKHGVFSIRSPSRPNSIGISLVKLCGVKENRLSIQGMDIVDGTPLLDIKPYVPEFDVHDVESIGRLGAELQTIFGGNITLFTELCEKTRAEAFDLMY